MGRIRSLHPEQWTDPEFLSCTPLARLLALGLRNEADDNGVFEWNLIKIKVRLLPFDACDLSALLDELVQTNQVHKYAVDGHEYGIIRSFQRFQSPRKPTFRHPIPELLPAGGYSLHPEYRTSTVPVPYQCGNGTGKLSHGSEGKGEEGNNEDSAEVLAPSAPPAAVLPKSEDVFLEFPIVGANGSTWPLTKAKLAEYHGTYGRQIDVKAEARKARQWCIDNPAHRKTARGMPAFLGRWFTKAVNGKAARI